MARQGEESLVGFAEAFGIVAGVSVVVAAVAVLAARALRLPLVPKWREPGAVWPGNVVFVLFLVYYMAVSLAVMALEQAGAYRGVYGPDFPTLAESSGMPDLAGAAGGVGAAHMEGQRQRGLSQLRTIWAGFTVVPLMVVLTLVLRGVVLNQSSSVAEFARPLPGRVVIGVWTGLFLVPVSFGIHALTLWTASAVGIEFDQHPLTVLTPAGDGFGGVVFALSVILVGPVVEELLFRGLLVNWASGEWYRPWILMAFAGVLASLSGTSFDPKFASTVFIGLLAFGLYAIQIFAFRVWPRFPTRTASAVWASSALFAAAHAPVWPTPIPLFVLALGLGYLTARTRDITAAVVVHGMFNAVSFVYLLRGG